MDLRNEAIDLFDDSEEEEIPNTSEKRPVEQMECDADDDPGLEEGCQGIFEEEVDASGGNELSREATPSEVSVRSGRSGGSGGSRGSRGRSGSDGSRPRSKRSRREPREEEEGDGDEDDDESRAETEVFYSMATKNGSMDPWTLGVGVNVLPPSNNTPMTATGWGIWSKEDRYRPHMHLAMSMIDSSMDPRRTGVFKSSDNEAINSRNSSFAAIFGLMMDYEAKGIFIDGHRIYPQESSLPGGETPHSTPLGEDVVKARAKAIKAMPPVASYQFKYRYPAVCTTENGAVVEIPCDEDFYYTDDRCAKHNISPEMIRQLLGNRQGEVRQVSRVAPCEIFVMETLYAQPTEATDAGSDPRGPVVGVRAHKLLFNKNMKPAQYVDKIINESQAQWRNSRASLCEDEKRGDVSNKAGKSTRAWVADPDVEKTSMMKYASITDNVALASALMQCGGAGCGGTTRHIYPNMTTEFGAGAALTPISNHSPESQHALAPECALNFRDGCRCYSKHPDYRRHKSENPQLYEKEGPEPQNGESDKRPYKHYPTRVANAFMVSAEGVPIKLMPQQSDANNYIGEDGSVMFPYPETCYVLVNPIRSKRDSTLPNRISTIPQVGTNVLKAFYEAKKHEAAIQQSVEDTRMCMATNNLQNSGIDDPSDAQLFAECERLKGENKPSIDEICRHLTPVFTDMLCPSTAQSALSKRLEAGRHVQPDSLDQTPADVAARRSKPSQNFTYEKKVDMRDGKLAIELSKVHDVVMEGANKLHGTSDAFADFRYKVKSELIEWFIRCFDDMYHDPQNASALWPNHIKVWQSTIRFIKELPARAKKYMQSKDKKQSAVVDPKHPQSHRGSANYAFLYDNRMKKSGLSPYGNYQSDVLSFLYYEVCGILGQANHIRNALHMLPYFSSCPMGFRPIVVINGKPGMCKSKAVECFSLIWNRPDLPDQKRSFFFASGSGSSCSYQTGEIAPASGGILVWDEPPQELTSAATKDEKLNNQKQNLKELCTNGSTGRGRCEQKIGADGEITYVRVEYTMRANHAFCCCSNLGAATHNDFKARPNDGKALEHRMVPLLSAEALPPGVTPKGTDTIRDDLAENEHILDAHTLVVSVTQMCLAMASLIKCLRPPREDLLIKTFGIMDDFVEKNYGINKPDSRRLELRRHEAMAKAFESAVVRVFLYKEEAVNYDHMLPLSKPHSNDPKENVDAVHRLAPFDLKHLAKVFQTVCYDQEVILEAWSAGLDRSLYTAPDMLHILLAVGRLHDIDPAPKKTKFGNGKSKEARVDPDAAPAAAQLQEQIPAPATIPSQQKEDEILYGAAGTQYDDGRGNLVSTSVDPEKASAAVDQMLRANKKQKTAGARVSTVDMDQIRAARSDMEETSVEENAQAPASTPPEPQNQAQSSLYQVADMRVEQVNEAERNVSVAEQKQEDGVNQISFPYMTEWLPQKGVPETALRDRMEIMQSRQRAQQYFLRMRGSMNLSIFKSDATHRDIVEAAFKEAPKRADGAVILPWKESGKECTMTIEEISHITLPLLGEVISSGYHMDDLKRWIGGSGSMHMFSSKDADNVFMGVHTNSFTFEKRPGAQNTALSCDICWRTCSTTDSDRSKEEDSVGSSNGSKRLTTSDDIIKAIAKNIEKADSFYPFKIDIQQLFDRMVQISSASQDDFRRILTSPSRDVLKLTGPMRGTQGSVLRVFDREEVGKFRDMETTDTSKSFKSIDDTSTVRMVIPKEAAKWAKKPLNEASEKDSATRNKNHDLIVGDIKDPATIRLDQLLEKRSLPAADMTLSAVIRGNPIKCTERGVYINSAFFIEQCRLNQEIDATLLTIPGLRSSIRCDQVIDDEFDSCKQEAIASLEKVAEKIAERTVLTPTDKDILECLESCFYYTNQEKIKDVNSAGKSDVSGELFEKLGIFLTYTAHELFDWTDDAFEKSYTTLFKKLYPNKERLRERNCETVSRFFQRISYKQFERTPKRLSFDRKFFDSDTGSNDANAGGEDDVTEEECIFANETHFNIHGFYVFDDDELRLMAKSLRGSSSRSSGSFLQRKNWRVETLKAKIDSGMISENNKFESATVAAMSTNLLINVMCEVAIESEAGVDGKICDVKEINRRAAYLRPMKHMAIAGTCRSSERETVRKFLAQKVMSIVKTHKWEKHKDISSSISSRGAVLGSTNPNIGLEF